MEILFAGLIVAVGVAAYFFAVAREAKKEHERLKARNALIEQRERDAINVILTMRQKGYEGTPLPPEEDDLESWAIDNEHEVEVERDRLGESEVERLLDLES